MIFSRLKCPMYGSQNHFLLSQRDDNARKEPHYDVEQRAKEWSRKDASLNIAHGESRWSRKRHCEFFRPSDRTAKGQRSGRDDPPSMQPCRMDGTISPLWSSGQARAFGAKPQVEVRGTETTAYVRNQAPIGEFCSRAKLSLPSAAEDRRWARLGDKV